MALTRPSEAIRDLPSFLIRISWQSGTVRFRICTGTFCFFLHNSFPRVAVVRITDQVWFPFAPWLSSPSSSFPYQMVLPSFQTQITIGKYSHIPGELSQRTFYLGCESGLGILRIFYFCTLADYLVRRTNSLFTQPPLLPPVHT